MGREQRPEPGDLFAFMVLPDNKQDLANLMKASRELNLVSNSPTWRKAFELYNIARGENIKASDGCSRCFNRVKEWLLS